MRLRNATPSGGGSTASRVIAADGDSKCCACASSSLCPCSRRASHSEYSTVAWCAGPSKRNSPDSIHNARVHSDSTWNIECEQNRIVVPFSFSDMMRS